MLDTAIQTDTMPMQCDFVKPVCLHLLIPVIFLMCQILSSFLPSTDELYLRFQQLAYQTCLTDKVLHYNNHHHCFMAIIQVNLR